MTSVKSTDIFAPFGYNFKGNDAIFINAPFGEWIKSTQKFAKSNKGSAKLTLILARILTSLLLSFYLKVVFINLYDEIIQQKILNVK